MKIANEIRNCPRCRKEFTIPVNKHIRLHCPQCDAKLEYANGVPVKVNEKPYKPFARKVGRLLQKILIGAIITWCLNFILLKTGWNEWKNVSEDISFLSEKIKDKAFTLSPMSILSNYAHKKNWIDENKGRVVPATPYSRPTIGQNIKDFFRNYWYASNGNAFWFGRILFIISCLISFVIAGEKLENSSHSLRGWMFPVNFIYHIAQVLFIFSVLAALLFLALEVLIFIGGGTVALFTFLATGGGFLKLLADEVRQEATDSPKNKVIQYVLALFPKKR